MGHDAEPLGEGKGQLFPRLMADNNQVFISIQVIIGKIFCCIYFKF